jgi:VanZ family protein
MSLLAALSLVPGKPQPGDSVFIWTVAAVPSELQKTMHVVMYGILAWLWAEACLSVTHQTRMLLVLPAAISIAFGAALEVSQLFVPGRYSSLLDVLFNTLGVTLGLIMFYRRKLKVTPA